MRLAVRSLALLRFRSYASARLQLGGGPVVVHGANGAGKTNLIEAVSLLSPGRGLRRAGSDELGHDGAEAWRVSAALDAPDGRHEVVTEGAAGGGSGRRVEIDGKAAAQVALGGVVRVLWLTPALDRLWTEAPAERRRFLDRVAMSLMPGHAEAALAFERALRERNRMIRDGVADRSWFAAVERGMGESGVRVVAGRREAVARLEASQESGPFPAARLALETEVPDEAEAYAEALAAGRGRDFAAGRTLLGPHRDDLAATFAAKGVPARLCSTGEQKALLLSLMLANARAVAEDFGAAPILLLDEVAAHLDPGRREDLFAAISALGAQAWMTGTEAALFAPIGNGADWLEVREGERGSGIRPGNHPARPPVGRPEGRSPAEGGSEMAEKDNPEAVRPGAPGAGENVCRKCEGTGKVEGETCPECGGSGKVTTPIGGA
jgi:DNA replication and repair protein RecF